MKHLIAALFFSLAFFPPCLLANNKPESTPQEIIHTSIWSFLSQSERMAVLNQIADTADWKFFYEMFAASAEDALTHFYRIRAFELG